MKDKKKDKRKRNQAWRINNENILELGEAPYVNLKGTELASFLFSMQFHPSHHVSMHIPLTIHNSNSKELPPFLFYYIYIWEWVLILYIFGWFLPVALTCPWILWFLLIVSLYYYIYEAFSGPVCSLHLFEKPAEQLTRSATEVVCIWYMENIVKDVSGAGILFKPIHKCFKSTRPVGGYFAESVTDLRELQAFVRVFGGYGVDSLDRMMKDHTAALLNCIDTSLRSNCEVLEAVAGSNKISGDKTNCSSEKL